jgi:nucleoside-diphosphate-sugar epimerase
MKMRFLVIGGTRFIGPFLVRELVDAGHEITVFHRGGNESCLPAGVRHIHSSDAEMPVVRFPADLLQPAPDVVIHMIPMGEQDTRAAVKAFSGVARRLVCLSSGDVYRAYGRFTGVEPGPVEEGLLTEGSPLRSVLYPYRAKAQSESDLAFYYEKILVERIAMEARDLPATILRLPKVYGPGDNADLATVRQFRNYGQWRWTHGYVENVGHAIALAAVHPEAAGRIYNVGEEFTPTVADRLRDLPEQTRLAPHVPDPGANFAQNIAYDTTRIRRELGYREIVGYEEGIRRSLITCGSRA